MTGGAIQEVSRKAASITWECTRCTARGGRDDGNRVGIDAGADTNNLIVAQPNVPDAMKGITGRTFTANSTAGLTLRAYIYTIAGERLATLEGSVGQNTVTWKVSGIASGIYIAAVDAKDSQSGLVSHPAFEGYGCSLN